jgi:uncharacterized protein YijF (DUF1287 family)
MAGLCRLGYGAGMMNLDRRSLILGAGASLVVSGCDKGAPAPPESLKAISDRATRLVAAARTQIGVTIRYDAAYSELPFPNGDVSREKGVCTDVIIRAYRDAFQVDLQAEVNRDMRAAFHAYPPNWGLAGPDRNIDHRRVPNLATWLGRRGAMLPIALDDKSWRPGDIFTSRVDNRGTHIGLVSDRGGPNGWLVIHNIGAGTREEDGLTRWPITGHYRWGLG